MPNITLAADSIETLPAPSPGQKPILYRDEGVADRMLLLRVSSTGTRSWLVEAKSAAGKEKQRVFGQHPAMSLALARREAFKLQAVIAAEDGDDAKAVLGQTLKEVYDDWCATQHPKDSTAKTYHAVIQTHAKDWWTRPLRAIKREEVIARCTKAWNSGAMRQGDMFFQTIRALCNHAKVVPNPASNIKKKNKTTRVEASRPLAPETMPALLDGIDQLTPEARAYFSVLLFTGFRGLGGKALRWEHLNLDERPSYHIPSEAVGFKKGGDWNFPLCAPLAEALRRYKTYCVRVKFDSPWLFPGAGNSNVDHQKRSDGSLRSLRKLSGLPGLRHNDFRDTWASYIQALYQKSLITERLLDHRAGGVNVSSDDVGILYATAIPASIEMSAQMQLAAVDQGEALRPLVDGYGAAILYLAGRAAKADTWTQKERRFYDSVDRTFLQRNPALSVERWLYLAAVHPQIAFAPEGAGIENRKAALAEITREAKQKPTFNTLPEIDKDQERDESPEWNRYLDNLTPAE